MQSQTIRGKMLPVRGGYWCCPYCEPGRQRKLLRIVPGMNAVNVPLYCNKCNREILVDVYRGQCVESPSPETCKG